MKSKPATKSFSKRFAAADSAEAVKQSLREKVWRLLEERDVALFPKPVFGRIPNFKGSVEAAKRLRATNQFQQSQVIKVNPDSPQKHIREHVLKEGKLLIMPTPRIKDGFLVVDPRKLPKKSLSEASTISGAFRFGEKTHPKNLPPIDLVVVGSVAVSPTGWRIGKGEGYSEIEFGILKTFGKIDDDTPVFTTVHDLQIVEEIPREPFDLPVDRVFTNSRIINCPKNPKPPGLIWNYLSKEKIESITLLKEIREEIF